jgi:Flp pilus assembly protein TadG
MKINRPNRKRLLNNSRLRLSRSGAAVVEFAVVAPVMILLTMGMIEVGRMVMVKQIMVNASREGARFGALPGSSNEEVTARVQSELESASIAGVQVTVTPAGLATAEAGTAVKVQLSVAASQISWVPNPLFSFSKNITTSTTMRRESQ